MATVPRQVRRLQAEHEAQLSTVQQELEATKAELHTAQKQIARLQADVEHERGSRVAAQRGLVAYMKEHGMGDRIGYDPDRDPKVREEIAAGRIPPSYDELVRREVIAETLAARTMG